jgi:hypothetical protein
MLRAAILAGCVLLAGEARAQEPDYRLDATVTFYGDNTEFFNPFRKGETILGAHALVLGEARTSDRLAIRAGVFGNQRFGSKRGFDDVRPVLALVVGPPASRLVLGTIDTGRRTHGIGPDRSGPHALLPPLQSETLSFDRPWEAGLQWLVNTPRVTQDAWVHWQRVATRDQRERFDTGITTRLRVHRAIRIGGDFHMVHEGGQLSSNGSVADAFAGAIGAEMSGPVGSLDLLSFEAFLLGSRLVPDREVTRTMRSGFGTFLRAAVEQSGWRGHALLWRGDDFITREGDANYQSIRLDSVPYRQLRDYAETGLTRLFPLAKDSWIEASARLHRVESHYEYSFRVYAVAKLTLD